MIKTDEELWEIIGSVKSFNNFLESFKQEILLSIPDIVIHHIQNQHKYKKIVDSFYEKYPDLEKDKVLVGSLANKIASENPAMSFEDVFKKAGLKARAVLRGQNEKL